MSGVWGKSPMIPLSVGVAVCLILQDQVQMITAAPVSERLCRTMALFSSAHVSLPSPGDAPAPAGHTTT